jgi:hypothetical protein
VIGSVLIANGGLALGPGLAAAGAGCPATVDVVRDLKLPRFFAPLTSGDREFVGHRPAITVSAKRLETDRPSGDFLTVVVKMQAQEPESDWTTDKVSVRSLFGNRRVAARLPPFIQQLRLERVPSAATLQGPRLG